MIRLILSFFSWRSLRLTLRFAFGSGGSLKSLFHKSNTIAIAAKSKSTKLKIAEFVTNQN
jgi:hypothetical protein